MMAHSARVISALLMAVLGVSTTANAAPLAISTTATGCGLDSMDNYTPIGPVTVGVQDSCFAADSNSLGFYQATSDILTNFGPALPQVGNVDAAASVIVTGTDPTAPVGTFIEAGAEASGSVTFFFTVEEIRTPPATFTPTTYFEASGNATIEGSTTSPPDFNYEGGAGAIAILPDGTQWGIEGEIFDPVSSFSDQFTRSIILDLAPNDLANPFYEVTIGAGCYVIASTGNILNSQAECHATVDPIIRLDQAAFDAKYGADSFLLSDYYSLQFSSNVGAVPVPAAVWLFGTVLIGLAGVGKRSKS